MADGAAYVVLEDLVNFGVNGDTTLVEYALKKFPDGGVPFNFIQQAAREIILGAQYLRSSHPGRKPALNAGVVVVRAQASETGQCSVMYTPGGLLAANEAGGECSDLALVLLQVCYGEVLPDNVVNAEPPERARFCENLRCLLQRKIDTADGKAERSLPRKFDYILNKDFMAAEMKQTRLGRQAARLLSTNTSRQTVTLPIASLKLLNKLLEAEPRVPVPEDALCGYLNDAGVEEKMP